MTQDSNKPSSPDPAPNGPPPAQGSVSKRLRGWLAQIERRNAEAFTNAQDEKAGSDPSVVDSTGDGLGDKIVDKVAVFTAPIWAMVPRWLRWLFVPFVWVFRNVARWYWGLVRGFFTRFSTNAQGEQPVHRRVLSGLGVGIVGLVLAWFVVLRVLPLAGQVLYDAALVEVFSKQDVAVFSKPTEVEGQPNVYSVFSCRAYPCEAQTDSVEYRMRDSLYLDIKRLITRLEPHDPGEMAGAFLSEENGCRYSYYGRRIKLFGTYPHIVSASCRPINGDNVDEVLGLL